MIDLKTYQTQDGKEYDCYYIQEDKIARAIGPIPSDQIGSRGPAFTVRAESEKEAKQNLAEAIGPGILR